MSFIPTLIDVGANTAQLSESTYNNQLPQSIYFVRREISLNYGK